MKKKYDIIIFDRGTMHHFFEKYTNCNYFHYLSLWTNFLCLIVDKLLNDGGSIILDLNFLMGNITPISKIYEREKRRQINLIINDIKDQKTGKEKLNLRNCKTKKIESITTMDDKWLKYLSMTYGVYYEIKYKSN